MIKRYSLYKTILCLPAIYILLLAGCKRDITGLQAPSFPATPEVFIDGFPGDLAYAAFGGSDVKAFQVDNQETYAGTKASMRIEVPDANSPQGSYAGGVYYSKTGRNLTGYNALTFYIKATQAATIGVIGFGNDLGESKYLVSMSGLAVNTNWKKVIIPIPDPKKLTAEKGMLFYSTGPEEGKGYTFWIDEVKFENVAGLAEPVGLIFNGRERIVPGAETGETYRVDSIEVSVNLPSGVNEIVSASPYYFSFSSTDSTVAKVNAGGQISITDAGSAIISATLGGQAATGSMNITSTGSPVLPLVAAPAPSNDAADVISLYSNKYTNVTVDTWNTRWLYSTAENYFIQVEGDDVIRYKYLNFVGIEFSSSPVDATGMSTYHMDMWTPDPTSLPNNFKVQLVDFGANGVFGGGDDVSSEVTITSPTLVSNNWVSLDIPFSSFTGLTTRAHLAQLVLSGTLPNVFVDNIYFYRSPVRPVVAAPIPVRAAADVLSVFSDSYTNIPGTDFNPNWGQATIVTQEPIAGNNTLVYSGLNYQGTQFASGQNVSEYGFLHIDYYTTNSSSLNVYLISPGPQEKPYALPVPAAGWNSVDIPLTAFSPTVALNNVIQMKFDGNGDIFLDNIYFYKVALVPGEAAPVPTYAAADVISVFSNSYTNIPGTDYNPDWGQATIVTQPLIDGNATLLYSGLNYQGTQFGSSQDVSSMKYLHLDYFSGNAASLQVFLISPGPVETPYSLTVPTVSGWNSVDIPLTAFAPVDLTKVFQMKFVGNGEVYLDNILFRK